MNTTIRSKSGAVRAAALLVLAALAALTLAGCATPFIPDALTPDLSLVADGRYIGAYDASMVKASVAVEVAAGAMTRIDILSHDCSPIGKKAETIVPRVLAAQSLAVDVVSGATGSSKTLLKAIEDALRKGVL
ncbi:MAG: FMN-binding protein [Spirochaetaceae bacterium]|nr:FMN-binding protein [Spirochaetaceae bacterium]